MIVLNKAAKTPHFVYVSKILNKHDLCTIVLQLNRRKDQMKRALEQQQKELSEKRKQFDEDKKQFDEEHQKYMEELEYSMRLVSAIKLELSRDHFPLPLTF